MTLHTTWAAVPRWYAPLRPCTLCEQGPAIAGHPYQPFVDPLFGRIAPATHPILTCTLCTMMLDRGLHASLAERYLRTYAPHLIMTTTHSDVMLFFMRLRQARLQKLN